MYSKVTVETVRDRYRPIAPDAHKGTQGHALLIGGSRGKMGAVTLASRAALRSGAGLVTALVPDCGYGIVQTAFPEAMVLTDSITDHIGHIAFDIKPDAVGVGPGIGQHDETELALIDFLKRHQGPLILDADALNLLAKQPDWAKLLRPGTILTPHPKELERLLTRLGKADDPLKSAAELAVEYDLVIVAKGAPTHIFNRDGQWENTTGNAALATAGSGDVLTGILTGLRARGFDAESAALIGVYVHGLTADLAVTHMAPESFIASDIIHGLGFAFPKITRTTHRMGFK